MAHEEEKREREVWAAVARAEETLDLVERIYSVLGDEYDSEYEKAEEAHGAAMQALAEFYRQQERARIVAWLRGLSGGKQFASDTQLSEKRQWEFDRATAWMDAADALERGEHMEETA